MIVYAEDITSFDVHHDLLEAYSAFSLETFVFLRIPLIVVHTEIVSHCVLFGNSDEPSGRPNAGADQRRL